MTNSRLARLARLALLTAAALVPLLFAKGGRDYKLLSSQVLILLGAAAGTVVLAHSRLRDRRGAPLAAAAWLAGLSVSVAVAHGRGILAPTAMAELARQALCLVAFLGAMLLLRPGDLRRLAALWATTIVFVGGYAIMQKAGWDPIEEFRKFNSQSRPFSTFGNPDFLGVHLAFLVPILLSLIVHAARKGPRMARDILLHATLFGTLVLLVWTGSRGAWLGASAGIAIAIPLLFRRSEWESMDRRMRSVAIAVIAVAFVIAAIWLAPSVRDALNRRTDRIPLWQGTMAMVRAKPITGWGVGSFPSEYPPFAPPAFAAKMKADNTFAEHPHCEYLHVAVEAGLPALGLFVWLLAVVLRQGLYRARAGDRMAAGALGALVAVLVHILVDRNFRLASTAIPFWLVAGVLFARREGAPAGTKAPGWAWLPLLGAIALAAVSLRPLLASFKVAREVDFLTQSAGVPAAQLEAQRDAHATDPQFLVALGNAWAQEKNFPRAIKAFEDALRLDPANTGAAVNLGNCWFMMSRFDEAGIVFRKVLERDPGHRDARFNLAMTYYYQRKIKAALAEVEILLRQDPANPKALQLKAQLSP
ncbi:MAG: O-antigen ligase family protein [Candidatus Coatesbacteria bacterium]